MEVHLKIQNSSYGSNSTYNVNNSTYGGSSNNTLKKVATGVAIGTTVGVVTGHASAGKCTVPQLKAMLAEMRAKSWTPRPFAGQAQAALRPLHAKIKALCESLERPLSYAEEIIVRQTKSCATWHR